jgi:hypothetical protein
MAFLLAANIILFKYLSLELIVDEIFPKYYAKVMLGLEAHYNVNFRTISNQ